MSGDRCFCGETPVMIHSPIGNFCSFTCMGDHIQTLADENERMNRELYVAYKALNELWVGMNKKVISREAALEFITKTVDAVTPPNPPDGM